MSSNAPRCAVRTATLSDVDSIMAVKQALRHVDDERGGFILGSPRELYCTWVKTAVVKVLQTEQANANRLGEVSEAPGIVGYAICLPDAVVRQSELWQKKDHIAFSIPIDSIVKEKIAYFEQLAVLPRYRRYVAKLLVATLDVIFAQGHQHLFSTTVSEPFNNQAAQGLYKRGAAQTVGYLREHYPEYGTIVSQLHYMPRANYQRACDVSCHLLASQASLPLASS